MTIGKRVPDSSLLMQILSEFRSEVTAGKGFFAGGELEFKERSKKEILNVASGKLIETVKEYYR